MCVCVWTRARACVHAVQCTRVWLWHSVQCTHVWLWHSLFSVGSLTQKPQLHQEQCTSEQGAQTIKGQQEAEVCGKNLVFYLLLQSLISCVSVHLLRLLVDDKRERLAESSKRSKTYFSSWLASSSLLTFPSSLCIFWCFWWSITKEQLIPSSKSWENSLFRLLGNICLVLPHLSTFWCFWWLVDHKKKLMIKSPKSCNKLFISLTFFDVFDLFASPLKFLSSQLVNSRVAPTPVSYNSRHYWSRTKICLVEVKVCFDLSCNACFKTAH